MELPLHAAALEKPTAEIVRPIYEALVTTFLGVTRSAAQAADQCPVGKALHPAVTQYPPAAPDKHTSVWLVPPSPSNLTEAQQWGRFCTINSN